MTTYDDGSTQLALPFRDTALPANPPRPLTLDDLERAVARAQMALAPIAEGLQRLQRSPFVLGLVQFTRELERSNLARAIRLPRCADPERSVI